MGLLYASSDSLGTRLARHGIIRGPGGSTTLDLDAVNGIYRRAGARALSDVTDFTRASKAWDVDAVGNVTEFPIDQIRSGQTLVNQIPNPRFEGSTPGVYASGGVFPTLWGVDAAAGLTQTISAATTFLGRPAIDLRLQGTASGTGYYVLRFQFPIAATPGQVWTETVPLALVAGSTANISSIIVSLRGSGGSFTPAPDSAAITGLNGTAWTLATVTGTAAAGVTGIAAGFAMFFAIGAVIDITLRFGAPQLELSPIATALTLPPVGTQRPSFRNSRLVTNLNTNPRGEGGTAGVIGSGGVVPTGWAIGSFVPTREFVGSGVDAATGVPYTNWRYSGVPTGTTSTVTAPQAASTGVVGDVYTSSVYIALIAGSLTNVAGFDLRTEGTGGTAFTPDATFRRIANVRTLTGTTPRSAVRWNHPDTTTAVDFTLRVGGWQLEQSETVGDLALPPPGTPAVSYTTMATPSPGWLLEGSATNTLLNSAGDTATFLDSSTNTQAGPTAPDGTVSYRLTSTVTGGSNNAYADKATTIPNDAVLRTFSVHLRKGTCPKATVNLYYAIGGTFIQQTGTVTWGALATDTPTLSGCSATYAGRGWWRVVISLANNSTGNTAVYCRLYVRDTGTANVTGEYTDHWGWQLGANYYASSYMPTTSAAVTRAASNFSLQGSKFTDVFGPGVTRTNLCLQSQTLDNATWVKTRATVASEAIAAPDGTTTADKLVSDNTAAISHSVAQTLNFVAGTNYTFSVFLKAAEWSGAMLSLSAPAFATTQARLNLASGVISGLIGGTASAVQYGTWWRLTLTASCVANGAGFAGISFMANVAGLNTDGDGASGIYVWGAQIETGDTATVYIPTTTTAQTKVGSENGCAIFDVLASQAGGPLTSQVIATLSDGTSANRMFLQIGQASLTVSATSFLYPNFTWLSGSLGNAVVGTPFRCGMRWSPAGVAICKDGGAIVSQAQLPAMYDRLMIGGTQNFTAPINGRIRRIKTYRTALSDAAFQAACSGSS